MPSTLAPFLVLTFGIAVFGACFPPDRWYRGLDKPTWHPPKWVFAPMWTVLYILMAIAGWRAFESDHSLSGPMLVLWTIQLVLNGIWTWLFFGRHRPDLAFMDVMAMLAISLGFMFTAAMAHEQMAFLLFLPYVMWVGFAAMLNYSVWQLNREHPEGHPRVYTGL